MNEILVIGGAVVVVFGFAVFVVYISRAWGFFDHYEDD